MKTILMVGCPGVGKTWVMTKLIERYELNVRGKVGMFRFHRDKDRKRLLIGVFDGSMYQGTDRLSRGLMKDVDTFRDFCDDRQVDFVLCEGDRVMNKTFIQAMKPFIIKIKGDGAAGRERRGSSQTERHIKAITTRVNNVKADLEVEDSDAALEALSKMIA